MKGKILGLMFVVMAMAMLMGCAGGNAQSGTIIGSIVINAPVEKVTSYMCSMSDAEMKEVFTGINELTNKKGTPCTIGSSWDQSQCVAGICKTAHAVWVDIVPNQLYQLKYAGEVNGTTSYLVSPEGKGTKLTIIMEINGKLPANVSYDMVKSEFQKGVDDSLAKIKAKVEKQ